MNYSKIRYLFKFRIRGKIRSKFTWEQDPVTISLTTFHVLITCYDFVCCDLYVRIDYAKY